MAFRLSLAASVLASGTLNVRMCHAHPGGDAPHQHAGRAPAHHHHHNHVHDVITEVEQVAERPGANFHAHVSVLGFDLTLPIPTGSSEDDLHALFLQAAISVECTGCQTRDGGGAYFCPDLEPRADLRPVTPVLPQERPPVGHCGNFLCDTARLERSGVRQI
jgi:hypothetical protein